VSEWVSGQLFNAAFAAKFGYAKAVKDLLARRPRLLFPMLVWPILWRRLLQRLRNRKRVLPLLWRRFRGFLSVFMPATMTFREFIGFLFGEVLTKPHTWVILAGFA
jgi:hypothetical protein